MFAARAVRARFSVRPIKRKTCVDGNARAGAISREYRLRPDRVKTIDRRRDEKLGNNNNNNNNSCARRSDVSKTKIVPRGVTVGIRRQIPRVSYRAQTFFLPISYMYVRTQCRRVSRSEISARLTMALLLR